jgi:diguanylate cyclase (GGDEF)-like protein
LWRPGLWPKWLTADLPQMTLLPRLETQETREQSRVVRFLWAAAAYGVCIALVIIAFAAGLVSAGGTLAIVLSIVSANAAIYAFLAEGRSERFQDPDLVWPQTLAAIALLGLALYHFDYDRGVLLAAAFPIFAIGLFRHTARQFLVTAALIFAMYVAVTMLLFAFKPASVELQRQAFHLLVLCVALPAFAFFCSRLGDLALRMAPARDEFSTAVATIEQLAKHDRLTRLANRAMFMETLSSALANAEREGRSVAVMFLDLDRFKNLNDTLGHSVGDSILQETARRLLATMRSGDFVARMGGDEFIVLVENFRGTTELADIASRLLHVLKPAYRIEGRPLAVGASVGICTFPEGATDCESLLSNADIALYRAKEQGRNRFCFYSAEFNHGSQERLSLEAALVRALENDELEVWYQPKVALRGGKVTGLEALVRWRHPEQGLIMPGRFIPLAEESGIIEAMDLWVVRRVCERLRHWRYEGTAIPPIAVNLSANQLHRDDLVEALAEIFRDTEALPAALELEITETAVMRDPERAVAVMQALKGMGLHLAIDDFGMGHSSLGYLKRFPVDSLKIDRTFVKDLPHDRDDVAITRAIIAMAHSLDMIVVAEGVERRDQFDVLRSEGCDQFQGFLCQPALQEADLLRFLADRGASRTGIRRRNLAAPA